MPEIFYTIDLTCQFCGLKVGEHELSSKFGFTGNETAEQLGFIDMRCDTHEQQHGNFKKMTEEARAVLGITGVEAEAFAKANRKKSDFDKELEKELKKK